MVTAFPEVPVGARVRLDRTAVVPAVLVVEVLPEL